MHAAPKTTRCWSHWYDVIKKMLLLCYKFFFNFNSNNQDIKKNQIYVSMYEKLNRVHNYVQNLNVYITRMGWFAMRVVAFCILFKRHIVESVATMNELVHPFTYVENCFWWCFSKRLCCFFNKLDQFQLLVQPYYFISSALEISLINYIN